MRFMKYALLLTSLLGSLFLFGQPRPFFQYYGEQGQTSFPKDFTITAGGNYQIFGNGNYEMNDSYNQLIYNIDATSGAIDSTIFAAPRNQNVLSAEEDGNGGAIVTLHTFAEDGLFRDLLIQYRDTDGTLTNEIALESPYTVSFIQSAIDEDGNHYVAYAQGISDYPNDFILRLLKTDAEGNIIYNIDLGMDNGYVYDLLPLASGEMIVVGEGREAGSSAMRTVVRLTASGVETWTINPDILLILEGLVYGNDLWLYSPFTQEITVVDIADGAITGTLGVSDFISYSLSLQLLERDGRFFFVGSSQLAEMVVNEDFGTFTAINEYEVETGIILRRARARDNGIIEVLSYGGNLQLIDTNLGEVNSIAQLYIPEVNAFLSEREATAYYDADNDQYTVSAIHGRDIVTTHLLTNDGSFLTTAKISTNVSPIQEAHPIALPEGHTGLCIVKRDITNFYESLAFRTYNTEGDSIAEAVLMPYEDRPLDILPPTYFPDGSIALSVIEGDPIDNADFIHTFKIPINGEIESTVGNAPTWTNSVNARQVTLSDDEVGVYAIASQGSELRIERLSNSFSEGTSVLTTLVFPGTDIGIYNNSVISWNKINASEGVLGFNIQQENNAPLYPITIAEEGAGPPFGFFPENIYTSAAIHYAGDNTIKLVGCSYNPDRTGADDRYLLRYETYDLSGTLLEETSHEISFPVTISNVSGIAGTDFLLVNGRYLRDFDTDALLIIIDGNGQITNLHNPAIAWAECTLSPNPSPDQLRIDLSNAFTGQMIVRLFNAQGQEIRQWPALKTSTDWQWQASLTNLPAGSYWVQVFSESGTVTRQWQKL